MIHDPTADTIAFAFECAHLCTLIDDTEQAAQWHELAAGLL